jgi:hypothetical protein
MFSSSAPRMAMSKRIVEGTVDTSLRSIYSHYNE